MMRICIFRKLYIIFSIIMILSVFDGIVFTKVYAADTALYKVTGYICPNVTSVNSNMRAGFKVDLVNDSTNSFVTITDKNGSFTINYVPKSSSWINLKISKEGYLSRNITINALQNDIQLGLENNPVKMLAGDMPINGLQDNTVNLSDVIEISKCFNTVNGDDKYNICADFNMDDSINISDIIIVAKSFNMISSDYPQVTPINITTPTPTLKPTSTIKPTIATIKPTPTQISKPRINVKYRYEVDKSKVTISYANGSASQEYRINESNWQPYTGPFDLTMGCKIDARSKNTSGTYSPIESISIPHPKRGVYAVWYFQTGQKNVLDLPYVVGRQAICQWADIAVEKDLSKWKWSVLKNKIIEAANNGDYISIQINGNKKPRYLKDIVPWTSTVWTDTVSDDFILMYWHRNFIDSYKDFIKELAKWTNSLEPEYKKYILGIRQNFNAIGTEIMDPGNYGTDTKKDIWNKPDTFTDDQLWWTPWTRDIQRAYEKEILQCWNENFSNDGSIFTFARAHSDRSILETVDNSLLSGKMGVFQTGAQPDEPISNTWFSNMYKTFEDYTMTGKSTGYSEPIGDSFGYHGSKPTDIPDSPSSYNYWRILLDLNYGISMEAIYGNDLLVTYNGTHASLGELDPALKQEYDYAFRFADKYIGYLNAPSFSPGTWTALRDITVNSKTPITDDCNFLMRRVGTDTTYGVTNLGNSTSNYYSYARNLPAKTTMKFAIDNTFVNTIKNLSTTVKIKYFDNASAKGSKFEFSGSGTTQEVTLAGDNTWKECSITIDSANFIPEFGDSAQIKITNKSNADIAFHMVEILK